MKAYKNHGCLTPLQRGPRKGEIPTGSVAGYERHRRLGEPPCDKCRVAYADASRVYYDEHKEEVREYQQQWREGRIEKERRRTREWARNNPIKVRDSRFRYRYGISTVIYEAMIESQFNRCAICSSSNPGKRGVFEIDHDHRCCSGVGSCGQCVRGLLCARCNSALGGFSDSPTVLRQAAAYLEKYTGEVP